jgi:broad specificity phosphatase PhoE
MEHAILVRHAESEFSVRGLANGDVSVRVALTGRGREQARRLGEELRDEPIDLCVMTEFQRVAETADLAVAGRDIPRLVVPELNEIAVGRFEGGDLSAYREWARIAGPLDECPGGGESRAAAIRRIVSGYRKILERPERTILVIAHGLVLRYVLEASEGRPPAAVLEAVAEAHPFRFAREELEPALEVIEAWCAAPSW